MKVLMVSTYGIACGIAEHAALLDQAVHDATRDTRDIAITIEPALLDPAATWPFVPDVLHLNFHDALHSRWHPDTIQRAKALGCTVLVTLHDSGTPNSDHARAICGAADYFVVHEPYDDLPSHGVYLRMGVLPFSGRRFLPHPEADRRPILGTVGHDFGFKCWDALARTAATCGWGLRICTPKLDDGHAETLHAANPWLQICEGLDRETVIDALHDCDVTAFTYVCHNTGQSGPLLLGIAARKPVIALSTCRMFRSLYLDPLGREAITWCEDFAGVADALRNRVPIARVDPAIVALAEQERWPTVGQAYARIYRSLGTA